VWGALRLLEGVVDRISVETLQRRARKFRAISVRYLYVKIYITGGTGCKIVLSTTSPVVDSLRVSCRGKTMGLAQYPLYHEERNEPYELLGSRHRRLRAVVLARHTAGSERRQ